MQIGLIISNISGIYIVESQKKLYECSARGKFKKEDEMSPVVGDNVQIDIIDIENTKAIINEILPRTNYIKRPKLANITQLVLVVSAKMPKPDLLMLDKQLAFAEFLNIKPIIVMNKTDLDNIDKIEEIYTSIGYTVITTNAKQGTGIEKLKNYLKNNISAFSGNSGVGKSTLLNNLFNNNNLTLEGEISKKNSKGKNTTTAVKLYELQNFTYIADTPGFSTFDIYEIKIKDLYKYFVEFNKYEKKCEFVGCTHIKETNCGIREELNKGNISISRYNNYIKIYNDLKDKEEHKW